MKTLYLSIILLIFSFPLIAQDVHLSQFYTNHQNLNPALCGSFEGELKLSANYRNQWRQISFPITTSIIAVEKNFNLGAQRIGAGLIFINDRFPGFNLNSNKIFVTGSYEFPIQGHYLRFGVQTGIVLKSTDWGNQTFPSQWNYDLGDFDTNLGNNEPILDEALNYVDFNTGLAWSRSFTDKIQVKAGYAIFHINRPNETYLGNREKLAWRHLIHVGSRIRVAEPITIEPEVMFMNTTRTTDLVVGTKLRYELLTMEGTPSIFTGALFRTSFNNPDAIIPLIGIAYKNAELGFSYDFNISGLSDTYNKTTYEISLTYIVQRNKATQISIPCERY